MTIKKGKEQLLFNKLKLGVYCKCRLELAIQLAKEKLTVEEQYEYFDFN